jgi:hypothetical protein
MSFALTLISALASGGDDWITYVGAGLGAISAGAGLGRAIRHRRHEFRMRDLPGEPEESWPPPADSKDRGGRA